MTELVDKIINKNFSEAEASLREELSSLVEKKLGEKKKMMAANEGGDTPFKSDAERTGSVKAKRKPLKGVTKVLKDIKEAIVHRDGLVHLTTSEKVLPSVYRQRRWLTESNESSDWFADTYHDLKGHKDKNVKHHVRMAVAQHNKGNIEDAFEHLRAAQTAAHKLEKSKEKLKEGAQEDAEETIDNLAARGKKAFPEGEEKIDRVVKDLKEKLPQLMQGAREALKTAKEKSKLDEDCGLAPDKEAILHAALDKARLILQPQLDTTAPTVNRAKVSIPKGTRPADRLTAPDLGPKEDEWMCGKKLDESKKKKVLKIYDKK